MSSKTAWVWSKKPHWDKYYRPETLDEALAILERLREGAKVIAGGTDLLAQIRKKEQEAEALVDITRIPGLDEIRMEGELIRIGALVTHSEISQSPLIRGKALALAEGAGWVGSPQIRNMGTVGGNIVSGQPGADATIPLLALGASVRVVSRLGERTIPLTAFFTGPGKTVLDGTSEILTEVSFPALGENEASATLRLAKRKALALPILTASVVVSLDKEKKRFDHVKIGLGPVAPVPFRASDAEGILASASISEELIRKAAQRAAEESNPRSNPLRGSEGYRRNMVAALVERGIRKGLDRLEVKHG